MGRLLAGLLGFLVIALVGGDAARAPDQYWKYVLPNTLMPSSLSKLLNAPGIISSSRVQTLITGGTAVDVSKGAVNVYPGSGKPVHSPFFYRYAATETQLHDDPSAALFFQEEDLHPGKKMAIQFTTTAPGARFLPRREAEAIPFSSEKLPEILRRFSVSPGSGEAAEMAQTLRDCEAPAAEGEEKACATSLESMVDFATSSLGTRDVSAVSTVLVAPAPEDQEGSQSPRQEYTMTGVAAGAGAAGRLVACHAEPYYAHAVFACHLARRARAYSVSMLGADGTTVDAVAVCHADTSGWNPGHVAFQVLGVKPGAAPVCHFLPQDHVVWTPSAAVHVLDA